MPSFHSGPAVVTNALCDAFMDNESGLCDASVLTSDGQIVYACMSVLAVRFSFFKSLFYASTPKTESTLQGGPNFSVPTDEKLTRSIIEFAYTNNCHTLVTGKQIVRLFASEHRITDSLPSLVLDTIDLLDAAHRLDILSLERRCKFALFSFMKTFPSSICTILEKVSLLQQNASDAKDRMYERLLSSIMNNIAQNPQESLLMPNVHRTVPGTNEDLPSIKLLTVADLSPQPLARIIDQQRIGPQISFRALYYWATFGCTLTENASYIEPISDASTERWELAKNFVKRIPLDGVSIAFLTKCVDPTKLVGCQQIAELYRTKLLQIEEQEQARKERRELRKSSQQKHGSPSTQRISSSSSSDSEESSSESESSTSRSDSEEDSAESSSESSSESDSSSDGDDNESGSDCSDSESSSDSEVESGSESTSSESESGSESTSSESESGRESTSSESESRTESTSSESENDNQTNATNSEAQPEIRPRATKRRRLQSA